MTYIEEDWYADEMQEDISNEEYREQLLDGDGISPAEAAFLQGYDEEYDEAH